MINRLSKREKSLFVVNSRCYKDGELVNSTLYDRFFTYRVINEDNYLDEILGYLEWLEKKLNEDSPCKYKIILLDIFQNVGGRE